MKILLFDPLSKSLHLGDRASPLCLPGSIRIQVRAFGVNRADLLQKKGLYPPPLGESDILGLEVAGTVVEKAHDVGEFSVGDRVMALLAGGGYAEEAVAPANLCLKIPDHLSFEEGAAIPEVFMTAHQNLCRLGQVKAGDKVLLHAGASGVGTASLQLLREMGAPVFTTVGSSNKAEACARLGATPIEYKRESFEEKIKESAPDGLALILDPVGGPYLEANLRLLAPEGKLIIIALMGGKSTEVDLSLILTRRLRIIGSTLRHLPLREKCEITRSFWETWGESLTSGKLLPIMDSVFQVAEADAAHQRMESNQNIGKIILNWP